MRIIAHIDMDAFFAAVEEWEKPRFQGKPLVVGADPKDGKGRGVVSTANYKAREYGIRSAMPISEAWRRSEAARRDGKEPAVFLTGNHRLYREVSARIETIIRSHIPHIEVASIDEFYCDMTFKKTFEEAAQLALTIKAEIKEKEHVTASVGIGSNKLIAKIASDKQKPDGLTIVEEDEVVAFLDPFSVRAIPGIGPKAEQVLKKEGITTIRELRGYSREKLKDLFGKWGADMYDRARGKSDSPIIEEQQIKSIGEQETFERDTKNVTIVVEKIHSLSRDVWKRLQKSEWKQFKTIVLTIRFGDFTTKSRSHTLLKPAETEEVITFEALKLLAPFFDRRENPSKKAIRLVGVRIEKLS